MPSSVGVRRRQKLHEGKSGPVLGDERERKQGAAQAGIEGIVILLTGKNLGIRPEFSGPPIRPMLFRL